MNKERKIILVLGYTDDLSECIEKDIAKNYDTSNGYSIGYYNSLHETIKFIFSTDSNILLYANYISLDIIDMINTIKASESYFNELIIYNYIDDLVDCSLNGKVNYYNKYNPKDYCDVYYEKNISTGFFKIYNDHVSKVKLLCNYFANSLNYNAYTHDSDKILEDDILKAYAIYYPELKKIPYFEEDGITRNKEYLDYEEKYMNAPMSKHCMYQDHHYYDWKNTHDADLMDMIEAIFDIYTAITLSRDTKEEPLNLENFVDIIKSKGILDNIEEKVINTMLKLKPDGDFIFFDRSSHLKDKLNSGKYRKLECKEALDYIKNRNKVFYNEIIESGNRSEFDYLSKEDGYFHRNTNPYRSKYATINIYINKENDNDTIITKEYTFTKVVKVFKLKGVDDIG